MARIFSTRSAEAARASTLERYGFVRLTLDVDARRGAVVIGADTDAVAVVRLIGSDRMDRSVVGAHACEVKSEDRLID